MTEDDASRRGSARTALVTGWIAAIVSTSFLAFWIGQLIVLEGSERFLMLNTLVAFAIGVWFWVGLAVLSLVSARRAGARSVAVRGPAVAALCATGVGIALAVVTLFQ